MIHGGSWHVWLGWALALVLAMAEVIRYRRRRARAAN